MYALTQEIYLFLRRQKLFAFSVLQVRGLTEEVSSVGFKALSKLQNLQKFLFFEWNWEVEHKCLLMCAQFLPRLQMAGKDTTKNGTGSFTHATATNGYHKELVEQEQRVPLGLQHLVIKGQVRLHPTCQLPELKALHLNWPGEDAVSLLDRFPTVTELSFFHADAKVVKLVLQKVGWRLSKLGFGDCLTLGSLPETLKLCPNLNSLWLGGCQFDQFFGLWPKNLMDHLEEVDIDMDNKQLPQGFIKQVNNQRPPS
jgi:hypothetical protein